MSESTPRHVYQPIHPEMVPKLLPEYVAFHNANTAFVPALQDVPWDPVIRQKPAVLGGSAPLKVGSIRDVSLTNCKVRVFTPEGEVPAGGWPVFIFYHGGGWTLGTIDTENSFSTNMCKRANCVVVSVDYRLGPENPYPAAVEDAYEALQWVFNHGEEEFHINTSRIAVGGSSSGGNLAAVATHKAALGRPPIPLVFQLLVVPVVDQTASANSRKYRSWSENANTPALTPGRMLWFRNNYTPNEADHTKWDNSPIMAPDDAFKFAPPAWIGVAELDILRDEGVVYGEKLLSFGVPVETKIYKGAPHPIMAQDGALQVGRQLVSDAAEALATAFARY